MEKIRQDRDIIEFMKYDEDLKLLKTIRKYIHNKNTELEI